MKNHFNITTRWQQAKISGWLSAFHPAAGIWLQAQTKQFKLLFLSKARKMDSNNYKFNPCWKVNSEITMNWLLMIPLMRSNPKTVSGQSQVKKYPWEDLSNQLMKPTLVWGLTLTVMVFLPNVSPVKIKPLLIFLNLLITILTQSL